jgi:hypothetical protein
MASRFNFLRRLTFKRAVLLALAAPVAIVVWELAAYPRGVVMAEIDCVFGVYSIKTAGKPVPWSWEAREKLRDRYGIQMTAEAGCEVTPWLQWYMDGYNSISKPAIEGKFGDDVVKKTYEEARLEYKKKHNESE